MGLVLYALGQHLRQRWEGRHGGLCLPVALLEESRLLGAGGIQCPLNAIDAAQAGELRRRAERYEMHVEAILDPPRDKTDLERFEGQVRIAKEGGARLARTVIIPGRRYERFKTLDEFRDFERRGLRTLQLAEPVLARRRFRLAVENHKDQRTWEKLATLERIGSEYVGLCVDVGNNFPLMEDPLETARAFAPWALTVHIKDQALRSRDDGFWLADVPLGEGFLDLPAIVKCLREKKPDLKFNFESITRDAIPVPILTEGFWATLKDTPARELARTLGVLKTRAHPGAFVRVSGLSPPQQLALERQNILRSLRYAGERLGI